MKDASYKGLPTLSKSRFIMGMQCYKHLYLYCYQPELADPVDASQQALFDAGTRVGELARGLYTGGVLIAEPYNQHEDAVMSTIAALGDGSVPALFEAAFLHDGIMTRIDILNKVTGGLYDIIEVKSGTSVKDEHIPDMGIQLYVLRGCGITVVRASLAHLNKEYVYPGGEYVLSDLFEVEDVTEAVEEFQADIPLALSQMRMALQASNPPDIRPGRQCNQPHKCAFYGHCHADQPEHPVIQLPRASQALLNSLEEEGIEDIRDIPEGFPGLNATQRLVCDCVINNRTHMDPELAKALAGLDYPIHFLDFETFNPALPLYIGTRPYQVIPFQWSHHTLMRDGTEVHEGFLHDGFGDPRETFAATLVKTLGAAGPVITYSSFESTRIRELARNLPHLAGPLLAISEDRIVDLLQLVRRHCYHPDFHGSFSLKAVLPALVPELSYTDLEIRDGDEASRAYAEMILPGTSPARRDYLRQALLNYCKRDTEAMMRLYQIMKAG